MTVTSFEPRFVSNSGRSASIVLSIIASTGTLTCCALPALFISLGAGAAVASLVTTFPFLITLSEHKTAVFGLAVAMLVVASVLQWRARRAPCPTDPVAARWCQATRRIAWTAIGLSAFVTAIGAFFAFGPAAMLLE